MKSLAALLSLALGLASPSFSQTQSQNKKPVHTSPQTAAPALAELTPEQLVFAEKVKTGKVVCEGGIALDIKKHPKVNGYFDLGVGTGKNTKHYLVHPEPTTTGVIRLESKSSGLVWMYLANKSMIMNERLGQRVADNCRNDEQKAVEAQMAQNPNATPNVLK